MGATNEQVREARALVKRTAETATLAREAILEAERERIGIERAILESDRRVQPHHDALLRAQALVARRIF